MWKELTGNKNTYRIKLVVRLMLFIVITMNCINVSGQKYTEYEVKSAYLFNYTKFIKWPESSFKNSTSPYIIGIYKDDGFGKILNKAIKGRDVNGRNVIIQYYNSINEVDFCHILFFPKLTRYELSIALKKLSNKPILTVGNNIEDFCESGGIINFTKQLARHRFEINNDAAVKSDIIISSKLLILAKIISEDEIKF